MTTTPSPGDLFGRFLNEPSISERAKFTQMAVDGRPPDEAVSVLFAALNIAVDHVRALSEIAISMGLSANSINDELQRAKEQRSSDYLEYQFRRIVDPLDNGTVIP